MRTRKRWFKKAMVTAVIVAVIGGGAFAAAELYDGHDKEAFSHTKQVTRQYASNNDANSSDQEEGHNGRGDRGEGHHEEGWDGAGVAAGIGGALLGAGLLYWIIRRRKRSGLTGTAQAAILLPTTTEFLDQWENNQINSKETK